jgi:Domain of unknown function (DUF1841)
MYGADRSQLRDVFFRAWRKHRENQPLEGVERIIVDIAQHHPEYHAVLDAPQEQAERDYAPSIGATNPFMHMALHIAIVEQLSIDQPPGVRRYFRELATHLPHAHAAEHAMMECLSETLWRAQQAGQPLDQAAYLDCLDRLVRRS